MIWLIKLIIRVIIRMIIYLVIRMENTFNSLDVRAHMLFKEWYTSSLWLLLQDKNDQGKVEPNQKTLPFPFGVAIFLLRSAAQAGTISTSFYSVQLRPSAQFLKLDANKSSLRY